MIPAAYITEWRSHAHRGPRTRGSSRTSSSAGRRAQFEANLHEKRTAPLFRSDIDALLRPGLGWDLDVAMDAVLEKLVAHLPGEPWKGLSE